MTRTEKIDWFFRDPRQSPKSPDIVSHLFLLRRDIHTCFGNNPDDGQPIIAVDPASGESVNCKALWPGVMGILAGIDLLGKFLAGNDKSNGDPSKLESVTSRFKNFLQKYFSLSETDGDVIYQLRNSLLHSFGLYSEKSEKGGLVKRFKFILTQDSAYLIQSLLDDQYVINIQLLRCLFNTAIEQYQKDLGDKTQPDYDCLQKSFEIMLEKHGAIRI